MRLRISLGDTFLENGRPTQLNPIVNQEKPQKLGTILIRFTVLFVAAIVILAILWNR